MDNKISIEEVLTPETIDMLYNHETQEQLVHKELFDFDHEQASVDDMFFDQGPEELGLDSFDLTGYGVIISYEEISTILGELQMV